MEDRKASEGVVWRRRRKMGGSRAEGGWGGKVNLPPKRVGELSKMVPKLGIWALSETL